MTYQEAKRAVFRRQYVRRASWPADRVLHKERTWDDVRGCEGWMIANHTLHAMGGSTFGAYQPTEEDEAATDWEASWHYP